MSHQQLPRETDQSIRRRSRQRTTKATSRTATGFAVGAAVFAALAVAVAGAAGPTPVASATATACAGSPVVSFVGPQPAEEDVGIDVSASTSSNALKNLYELAAATVVARAAAERVALRIVAFGASGVGATVLFQGSFAPATADEVYDLAAANRARCWANASIRDALGTHAKRRLGTDVAGAASALITEARSETAPGGRATVTLITDGCQSPARSGANRSLTDLCSLLKKGNTTTGILRAHAAEFRLPQAIGLTFVMKGLGVGRDPAAASTELARRIVWFWAAACRNANASACVIGSVLP